MKQNTARLAVAVLLVASLLPLGPTVAAELTVVTLADTGAGSLRTAVFEARIIPGDDVIVFAPGLSGTVQLASPDIS